MLWSKLRWQMFANWENALHPAYSNATWGTGERSRLFCWRRPGAQVNVHLGRRCFFAVMNEADGQIGEGGERKLPSSPPALRRELRTNPHGAQRRQSRLGAAGSAAERGERHFPPSYSGINAVISKLTLGATRLELVFHPSTIPEF